MELDTRCVMCRRISEDGGHLFFHCKYVKPVWLELNLEETRCVLASKQPPKELLLPILGVKEGTRLRAPANHAALIARLLTSFRQ